MFCSVFNLVLSSLNENEKVRLKLSNRVKCNFIIMAWMKCWTCLNTVWQQITSNLRLSLWEIGSSDRAKCQEKGTPFERIWDSDLAPLRTEPLLSRLQSNRCHLCVCVCVCVCDMHEHRPPGPAACQHLPADSSAAPGKTRGSRCPKSKTSTPASRLAASSSFWYVRTDRSALTSSASQIYRCSLMSLDRSHNAKIEELLVYLCSIH